jgi:hypothetical protein
MQLSNRKPGAWLSRIAPIVQNCIAQYIIFDDISNARQPRPSRDPADGRAAPFPTGIAMDGFPAASCCRPDLPSLHPHRLHPAPDRWEYRVEA